LQRRRNSRRGHPRRCPRRWVGRVPIPALLALLAGTFPAAAEEEPGAPPPEVPLERLLTVPRQVDLSAPRPGGATRSEWRARFAEARAERDQAQAALAASQSELEELAGETDNWKLAAPGIGAGSDTGPLSYRLRQEIRRHREEIERAEHQLRELRVEANLAGVPDGWIEPEDAPGAQAEPGP
jgi:hypothetical protein